MISQLTEASQTQLLNGEATAALLYDTPDRKTEGSQQTLY